ncbi:MAG: tryptophan synthase subunit alpha [Lentisphaeria bacterium]|nr:tryptophan synthase subunit alpha [Lentisphaeria bacterium]
MNRLDKIFSENAAKGRKTLVMFVSAGDPDLAFTEALIPAIVAAGADIVEIGVPFSDPMADGPTIQAASQRALAAGVTLPKILAMVKRVREAGCEAAFVLFSYYNVLLQYGVDKLAADSAECGLDGWLVVDVPPEEEEELLPAMEARDVYKITLLAPTTPRERARDLVSRAKGFVYYITVTGVTGARTELPADLADHLETVKAASTVPVVAGFGVSRPDQAAMIAKYVDGVVVGSKLIKTIAESDSRQQALADAVSLVKSLSAVM